MSQPAARVLAVDDNATIRKAISMRLKAKGFDVTVAASGHEALRLLAETPFDLVLLDLQMPELSGIQILEVLRRRFDPVALPIIILAASDDRGDIDRALDLGANDYVVKPGDLPMLLARIRTHLALKKSAERIAAQERSIQALTERVEEEVDVAATAPSLDPDGRSTPAGGSEDPARDPFESTAEYRYHVLYDNTPMICFSLDPNGRIISANRYGTRFFGYDRGELVGESVFHLYPPDDRAQAMEHLNSVIASPGRIHRWEIRRTRRNGDLVWMRETARSVGRDDDRMILMTCEDIEDTYSLSAQLNYQASHDQLTGLGNRKTLEERLERVIDSAQREQTDHTLAVLDVDQFKLVNDTCGHEAGDKLLQQVAQVLTEQVRTRDTLARLGSDEFALLIEDCSLDQGRRVAEGLRRRIEDTTFAWNGRDYRITVSVGLVAIGSHCDTAASALSMADTACFAAKDGGRNRIHAYQEDNLTVITRHGEMRWVTRINDALNEDRFELNMQPIAPIRHRNDGDHYELLIRMRDESGGIVMPGEFLPAAERYNLAHKLDRWVIAHALRWLGAHPDILRRLHLCGINLSGQSMGNDETLSFILDQLAQGIVPAHKLCFEVTETAAISDFGHALHFISALRERGCKFALDDFGSGFSSFNYLKRLPVDFLKIDGSFVRDIATDSTDLAMVRSINEIGHVMGKQTIAEFVEDRHVLDLLRSVGVDYAQGYEIGRPTPIKGYLQSPLFIPEAPAGA